MTTDSRLWSPKKKAAWAEVIQILRETGAQDTPQYRDAVAEWDGADRINGRHAPVPEVRTADEGEKA